MRGISPLIWVAIVAAIVVVLYFVGGAVSKQSITIAGCNAEWGTIPQSVHSDLCPNPNVTCTAEPFAMQHNAIVDALLCACAKVTPDYADSGLNTQIEDAYKASTNLTLTVREICEGGQLTKWRYRA